MSVLRGGEGMWVQALGQAQDVRATSAAAGRYRALAFAAPPSLVSLYTTPPFMTKVTRSSRVISASGSPSTAIRSANSPGATAPTWSDQPSRSAALLVAD